MAVSSSWHSNGSRLFMRVILIGLFHLCLITIPSRLCLGDQDGSMMKGGCTESERRALLAIKGDIYDPDQWLSSWKGLDCCQWRGVDCDNSTGHVVKLDLRYPYDIYAQIGFGKLPRSSKVNPSLLDLMHLKYLDFSLNNFSGASIPRFIGSLTHLVYLNLSNAKFSGSIPPELGNLSALQFLDLHLDYYYYSYYYSTPWIWSLHANDLLWLSNIHSLQHLDLSGINLSRAANWLYEINMHLSLLELHLYDANLPFIHRPLSHNNLTALEVLDLSQNYGINTTFVHLLVNISSSLVHLDLSGCGFSDKLLVVMEGLCNLQHLDLSYNQITRKTLQKLGNLSHLEYLDLSANQIIVDVSQVLAKFGHLKNLHLSNNNIHGEIPEKFGYLTNLESFFMADNKISGQIPKSIGNLHNLTELDLSANYNISGEIPKSIGNLIYLQMLDLSDDMISGEIPESIENLIHLQVLDLSGNMISGEIPDVFDKLHNLQLLNLSRNRITGKIPKSFKNLCNLILLYIFKNNISGEIVDMIEGLSKCIGYKLDGGSSLRYLDVIYNNFSGIVPRSLGKLSALRLLFLGSNSFTGRLTEAHFANLTKLEHLILSDNLFEAILSQNWIPPFNAKYIEMRSCHLGPNFPTWLQTQTNLRHLGLSENSISNDFPAWFWDLKYIYELNVSHNGMKGRLPTSSRGQRYEFIDMSSNNFHGPLPNWDFSGLYSINLSNNSFEGPIFLSFAKATRLQFLSLSNNYINGSIPLFICNLTNLAILDLSNNKLSGKLPNCWHETQPGIIDSKKESISWHSQSRGAGPIYLQSLHMRSNSLSGGLPLFLRYCKQLAVLDLSENKFSGNLPKWIGESLTSLKVLSMRSNFFRGNIPKQLSFLTSLQVLDLACNNFSGFLPRSFGNFRAMMVMHKANERILTYFGNTYYRESLSITTKGIQIVYTSVLLFVTSIDISNNHLSGMIPEQLVNLHGLIFLNLSNNHFTGKIPENIGALEQLESLDLSINNLSGMIPSSISSLYSLGYLNLSHNNLSGRIPWGKQLQTFCDRSIYDGNRDLQGWPLPWCFNNASAGPFQPRSQEEEHENKDEVETMWLYLSFALGFVVGLWGFIYALMIKQKERVAYFRFIDEKYDWIYVQLVVNYAKLKRIMLSNGEG